jgi:extracellular factor (EF) 3-hydroxypalmitic acid methyl ester biosynthesis protein
VSRSNIARKNHLKTRILEELGKNQKTKILSVGCGPAREIIELLKEKEIRHPVEFNCLDLEKKAIEFVKTEIQKISFNEKLIQIRFFPKDLMELARNKDLAENFQNSQLIYISGVFDYFTDRLCKRTLRNLFPLLAKKGTLIAFNMSLEDASNRAYYEIFAKWVMIHRTKKELLSWVEGNMVGCRFYIHDIENCPNYHILNIVKDHAGVQIKN